jgi:hypothetical protein
LIKLSPTKFADNFIKLVALRCFSVDVILAMKATETGPQVANRTGSSDQGPAPDAAHQLTIRLGIQEITQRLNACLGGTLVASLAGAKDNRASYRWAKEDGPEPRPEVIKRLMFAYEQWWKIAETEREHVARAWFIGGNPWLGDSTPVTAIREDRLAEVRHAAQALVDDAFGA